jgi:D-alanyl-lipoteichoic acid acyltransferase DltB (MBOAT superfamily)
MVGDRIQRAVATHQKTVQPWLIFGLVVDISLLGYFKYANFFVDNVNALTDANWTLDHIVLPLAISFYTFQKIAYLVDSARGEARPMTILDFTLFAAFFPQLIAGPIVHYKEVVPQLQGPLFGRLIWRNLLVGLTILSIGLFKKTVIADTVSGYSDSLYHIADSNAPIGAVSGWLAAVLYTFQVYFDFSGYSDMAIGLARMFGVKLPLNFHSPLRAANIADYWRRWHMTLQRMIYAYVFQPLSLSLIRSTWRLGLTGWGAFAVSVGVPTFLTFVIVGVWHGAGWTFVTFGVMHAVYVSVFEIWRERRTKLQRRLRKLGKKLTEPGPTRRVGAQIVTLVAILLGNVMFRAKTVGAAVSVWAGMAGLNGGLGDVGAVGWDVAAVVVICAAIVAFFPNTQQIMGRFDPAYNWREWSDVARPAIRFTWKPNTVGLVGAGVILFFGIMFIQRGQAIFLYFNF